MNYYIKIFKNNFEILKIFHLYQILRDNSILFLDKNDIKISKY